MGALTVAYNLIEAPCISWSSAAAAGLPPLLLSSSLSSSRCRFFSFHALPACWVSLLFSSEIIFSTRTTTAVVCLVFLFRYPQKLITLYVSCVSNVNQEILLGLVPRDSFDLRKKIVHRTIHVCKYLPTNIFYVVCLTWDFR